MLANLLSSKRAETRCKLTGEAGDKPGRLLAEYILQFERTNVVVFWVLDRDIGSAAAASHARLPAPALSPSVPGCHRD